MGGPRVIYKGGLQRELDRARGLVDGGYEKSVALAFAISDKIRSDAPDNYSIAQFVTEMDALAASSTNATNLWNVLGPKIYDDNNRPKGRRLTDREYILYCLGQITNPDLRATY
jgi:hypothetical protein